MKVVNSVRDASQIGEARRAAAGLAHRKGFSQDVEARIALVATEMATNLLKHAGEAWSPSTNSSMPADRGSS
jgi:anti-sigma regulatory factor (Ser/Thr protein kinase)